MNAQLQDFSSWMYRTQGPAGYYPSGTLGYSAALNYGPNGAGGTVCNRLVKLDGVGKLVVTAGGETSGVIGVAVAGCGTTGTVQYAVVGQVAIIFDTPTVTVSDYVGISSGSGLVADVGATPGSGQNIGQIIRKPDGSLPTSCNAGANCYVQLQIGSASGGGGSCGGGGCVLLGPVGNQIVVQPGGTQLTVQGQFAVQAPGPINGFFGPDSGASAQSNGNNNSWQFSSGTPPSVQSLPPGGNYLPVWAPRVSGVTYPSVLESQANKDAGGGYPSLSSLGQIPLADLIAAAGVAGCTGVTFVKGDFSGCGTSSVNPGFGNITTAVNNSATMTCDTGCTLTFTNNGVINASTVGGNIYPGSGAGAGAFGVANRVGVTIAANNVSGVDLPNCGSGSFLQYNTSTHSFPCNAPGGSLSMVQIACSGAGGLCPDTSAFTGSGAQQILISYTLPANTLGSGKCAHGMVWFQHTGAVSVVYQWNVGGTGARGATVSGGINATNQNSTSASPLIQAEIYFCNTGTALASYLRVPQMQAGNSQIIGGVTQGSIAWTANQQTNFTFNVAATDTVTFNGGYINFL